MLTNYINKKSIIFFLFFIIINIVDGDFVKYIKEFNGKENYISILLVSIIIITILLLIEPLLSLLLSLIGFGIKGPIKYSVASSVQYIIGVNILLGKLFSFLQSIAMKGITLKTKLIIICGILTLFYYM